MNISKTRIRLIFSVQHFFYILSDVVKMSFELNEMPNALSLSLPFADGSSNSSTSVSSLRIRKGE